MPLPPFVPKSLVSERLPIIFPEGTSNRQYCVRDLAASTVFVLLYIGAVEGSGQYLSPKHVYRMTEEQAVIEEDLERLSYGRNVPKPGYHVSGVRWYEDNTREPIRDETLREGFVALGVVISLDNIPTTSSKPRYALKSDFADLFNPNLTGNELVKAIENWRLKNLSPSALARVSIMRRGVATGGPGIRVTFPNGETRQLSVGPSSIIAQAVIEEFTAKFLEQPAVLWLSESGKKVIARDDELAKAIGLKIDASRDLPDLILADLGPEEPLLVFVEVVATDGAITSRRKEALYALTDVAGFKRGQVAFLTAYRDRESSGFKKTNSVLAWGTFAWFMSEPDQIIFLREGKSSSERLYDLLEN